MQAAQNSPKILRILVSTGIFPPKIGGPAQYAKNLEQELSALGHVVQVQTYGLEEKLPTGLRHFFYFCRILPKVFSADSVIIMDTFSVGFPTVLACKLFRTKNVIRTGGDFLWEGYVERTKKKVLLRDFYTSEIPYFSLKEKIIFSLTKWTLRNTSKLIFSTAWQRDIFLTPYHVEKGQTAIIENYFGMKEHHVYNSDSKEFVASTRKLQWKNLDTLELAFYRVQNLHPDIKLFTANLPYQNFLEVMKQSRAVVLVSLGDISPNMILDAIRLNIPFICTKEVGMYDRIKDAGIFVDPLNEKEIEDAITQLASTEGYREGLVKVKECEFTHLWEEIVAEFIDIMKTL